MHQLAERRFSEAILKECLDSGMPRIDCHKGIAHELPDMHDAHPGFSIDEI